jgi:hypothetical protein
MTDQGRSELTTAISTCAAALQTACIVKTGMIQVHSATTDKREWAGPALRPGVSYAGIDLNNLPRMLYSEDVVTSSEVESIWNTAVQAVLTSRDARVVVHDVFPSAPVLPARSSPAAPLIQLLCLLSWSGGTFVVTGSVAQLQIGSVTIGIDSRMINVNGEKVRLPRQCPVHPTQVLSMPAGGRKRALAETTALFRHLTRTFPESTLEIDTIFATAVAAGREFERKLFELHDVIHVDDAEKHEDTIWTNARRIVRDAQLTPNRDLWSLLKGTVPHHAFNVLFGNPNRNDRATYSPTLRRRHTAALDRLESGQVALKVKGGDQAEKAMKLLQLQRMMGPP